MSITPAIIEAFAPTGVLRASINLGNPILARRNAEKGEPEGVSIDLARAFGAQLGVPVELVVFDTAGKSVEAVTAEQADIGFFAVDPLRGQGIRFTAPYVLIEGSYLVRAGSPISSNDEVDRAGVRVMVGKGSAYDLYLTRELKSASIERAPTSQAGHLTFCAVRKPEMRFAAIAIGWLCRRAARLAASKTASCDFRLSSPTITSGSTGKSVGHTSGNGRTPVTP